METKTTELETKATELRTLTFADMPMITRIVNKIGVGELKNVLSNDSLMKLMSGAKGNSEIMALQVAFEIADVICKHYDDCSSDLVTFMASITGRKTKDIEALSLDEAMELIIQICQKDEFKRFFGVVLKYIK